MGDSPAYQGQGPEEMDKRKARKLAANRRFHEARNDKAKTGRQLQVLMEVALANYREGRHDNLLQNMLALKALVAPQPCSSAPQNPEKSVEAAAFVFGSNLAEADLKRKRKMEQEVESFSSPDYKKLNLSEREVITGEEDELNVMQLQVNLFIFDSVNSSWVKRDRGTLRLHDSKCSEAGQEGAGGGCSSRLIVRCKDSLRVILTTKVWHGMRMEKVGDEGVRLMAVDLEAPEGDDGKSAVRMFLIMTTSIYDANSLVGALESRMNKC